MADINFNFYDNLREWQKKCIDNQKRFTVLAVHRRAGKTTLSINLLVAKACDTANSVYCYIAPELKQAKLIAWKSLKDTCERLRRVEVMENGRKAYRDLVEFRESELIIRFWNGSEIRLFGADNPDSLRGSKLAGAVIDEVAQMPKELWLEIVYPALMDSKGWALFIGTPKGVNLFSELFYKGQDSAFSQNWVSQKFTVYETDALSEDDIELYRQSVPEEVFKREMLCDFTASGENNLISLFDAQQSASRTIDSNFLGRCDLVMGVDVARFGTDRSVICFRKGMLVEEPIELHGLDLVTLSRVIKEKVNARHPRQINIDGTGVGGGVVDILSSWGIFANDINFGHKSLDQQYTNRRTEMWCRLANWLHTGGVIPNSQKIVEELAMPLYTINDKNQKSLESKKQIRDRLGKSPDIADAIALTFAEELPQSQRDIDTELLLEKISHRDEFRYHPFNSFINDLESRNKRRIF